jgi:hypothetical protein
MPDYASILKRSISGLADPSPEMREAVYQRARAALARQLTAVDPPLSTREIELQHQELEDAVARLEAEFAPEPASDLEDTSADDNFDFAPQDGDEGGQPSDFGADADTGPYEDEEDDYEDDDDEPGSRLPLLVGIVAVLVLVVVGVGAYVYATRDTLFGTADDTDQIAAADSAPVGVASSSGSAETPSDEPEKRPDRLTNGPEAPAATASAEPQATVVEPTPATPAPSGADSSSTNGLPLENLSGLGPEDNSASDTNLVEQRAIYYYQGSEGQPGQANEGSATWAEITKDNRPAIQATLKIPERDVTVTVTIYKNYDTSLPASHLVEVQFYGALSDSPVQRVPALVLKQTEQARGQPLAGAAVQVTNELFWIALSSDDADVARNVQLLREGSWFDIPILFTDQTRALITFEKGIPGDKVFETVMASWTPS